MRWTPYDYYNATFREYFLAQEGYWEEDRRQQEYMRRQTNLLRSAWLGKDEVDPRHYWPIGGEARPEEDEKSEMLRRIEKRQQLLKALKEKEALVQDEKGL